MKKLLLLALLVPSLAFAQIIAHKADGSDSTGGAGTVSGRAVVVAARAVNVPRVVAKVAVSDNFNRANGALGGNWTAPGAPSTTYAGVVYSNEFGRMSAGSGSAYWSANVFSSDHFAEAYFDYTAATNMGVYLWVRAIPRPTVPNALNGYCLNKANTVTTLYKATDASFFALATCTGFSTRPIVRIEAVGATISVYELSAHGGTKTLRCSVTDSTYAAGAPGVAAAGQFGGGFLDNFYGGDL